MTWWLHVFIVKGTISAVLCSDTYGLQWYYGMGATIWSPFITVCHAVLAIFGYVWYSITYMFMLHCIFFSLFAHFTATYMMPCSLYKLIHNCAECTETYMTVLYVLSHTRPVTWIFYEAVEIVPICMELCQLYRLIQVHVSCCPLIQQWHHHIYGSPTPIEYTATSNLMYHRINGTIAPHKCHHNRIRNLTRAIKIAPLHHCTTVIAPMIFLPDSVFLLIMPRKAPPRRSSRCLAGLGANASTNPSHDDLSLCHGEETCCFATSPNTNCLLLWIFMVTYVVCEFSPFGHPIFIPPHQPGTTSPIKSYSNPNAILHGIVLFI
jgi:hypothetical protein